MGTSKYRMKSNGSDQEIYSHPLRHCKLRFGLGGGGMIFLCGRHTGSVFFAVGRVAQHTSDTECGKNTQNVVSQVTGHMICGEMVHLGSLSSGHSKAGGGLAVLCCDCV
jgi:hypothetical protein